jgi:hypothetical protein
MPVISFVILLPLLPALIAPAVANTTGRPAAFPKSPDNTAN